MKPSQGTHEGRLALVMGAAQGIGQAIALALAVRGARVIATDLTPPLETAHKIGPAAHAFQLGRTREVPVILRPGTAGSLVSPQNLNVAQTAMKSTGFPGGVSLRKSPGKKWE